MRSDMSLSKTAAHTLMDLVENKLASLQIGGREDLREMVVLQRCLSELRRLDEVTLTSDKDDTDIPRRGRHRKMEDLVRAVGERERETA